MKKILVLMGVLTATVAVAQSKKELQAELARLKTELTELRKPRAVVVETPYERVSYGLGVLMGATLKTQGADSIDFFLFQAAIEDLLKNRELRVSRQDALPLVQTFLTEQMERKNEKRIAEGQAFLEANQKKEGVITTASGLQYQVVQAGSGRKPGPTDRVTVHYSGRLIDGSLFDSSVERGQPATFGVNQVISGWTEALQLMTEGSKWILYIPSNLGYGERGAGGDIPPHAVLIFDVELIRIN